MAAAEEKALQAEVDKLKADLAGRDQQITNLEASLKTKTDELAQSAKTVSDLQADAKAKDEQIAALKSGGDAGKAEATKAAPKLVTAKVTNKHKKALTIAGVTIAPGKAETVEKFNRESPVIKAWISKGVISVE